jgi:hypothetical protein
MPNEWMLDPFEAGVVVAHVVTCPANAELVALRRELADQIRQILVVRVAARFGA